MARATDREGRRASARGRGARGFVWCSGRWSWAPANHRLAKKKERKTEEGKKGKREKEKKARGKRKTEKAKKKVRTQGPFCLSLPCRCSCSHHGGGGCRRKKPIPPVGWVGLAVRWLAGWFDASLAAGWFAAWQLDGKVLTAVVEMGASPARATVANRLHGPGLDSLPVIARHSIAHS